MYTIQADEQNKKIKNRNSSEVSFSGASAGGINSKTAPESLVSKPAPAETAAENTVSAGKAAGSLLADTEFNIAADTIRCQNLKKKMNIRLMSLRRRLNSSEIQHNIP